MPTTNILSDSLRGIRRGGGHPVKEGNKMVILIFILKLTVFTSSIYLTFSQYSTRIYTYFFEHNLVRERARV